MRLIAAILLFAWLAACNQQPDPKPGFDFAIDSSPLLKRLPITHCRHTEHDSFYYCEIISQADIFLFSGLFLRTKFNDYNNYTNHMRDDYGLTLRVPISAVRQKGRSEMYVMIHSEYWANPVFEGYRVFLHPAALQDLLSPSVPPEDVAERYSLDAMEPYLTNACQPLSRVRDRTDLPRALTTTGGLYWLLPMNCVEPDHFLARLPH